MADTMAQMQMVKQIEQHGVAVIGCNENEISVVSVFSRDGKAFEEVEQIPANWSSVRDYLGY